MILGRYVRWLHTGWPAGTVERLPEGGEGGVTAVPGVRIVGDLTGIPLLKFSADTGARAVQAIAKEDDFARRKGQDPAVYDLAIIGAGVSGVAAAMEAHKLGLRYALFEAAPALQHGPGLSEAKPIYTYPTDMTPAGDLQLTADVKEALLEELEAYRQKAGVEVTPAHVERIEKKGTELLVHHDGDQPVTRALRVDHRHRPQRQLPARSAAPARSSTRVYHRLYDPKDYAGKQVLVVGGGDSALESAIALTTAGAHVTLSYRNPRIRRAPSPTTSSGCTRSRNIRHQQARSRCNFARRCARSPSRRSSSPTRRGRRARSPTTWCSR